MKKSHWRFYRFRRKHKKWYLTGLTTGLSLVLGLLLALGFSFFYPKGLDTKVAISTTSNQTLAGEATNSSEHKKSSPPQISISKRDAPVKKAASQIKNTTSSHDVSQESSITEAQQTPLPVTYTATVGAFTRYSTLSQEDAQNKAQAAYQAQIEQEQAYQKQAEALKASIEKESPGTQVNIINQ